MGNTDWLTGGPEGVDPKAGGPETSGKQVNQDDCRDEAKRERIPKESERLGRIQSPVADGEMLDSATCPVPPVSTQETGKPIEQ